MVARVKVKSADGRSRFFEIPENAVLTIGRSDAADIVLDDMTVSRRHAVVGAAENGCFIEDNSSTSGTWINGERISGRRTVLPSDNIKIGGFELSVSAGTQAAAGGAGRKAPPPSGSGMPVYNAQTETEMYSDEMLELARVVQSRVLEILNITGAPSNKISAEGMRPKVEDALDQALREIRHRIPGSIQIEKFRAVLMDDLIGLGPLSPLLRATDIS